MAWCYFEQILDGKWKYKGPFKKKPDAEKERDLSERPASCIYYSNHVGTMTTYGEVENGFLRK